MCYTGVASYFIRPDRVTNHHHPPTHLLLQEDKTATPVTSAHLPPTFVKTTVARGSPRVFPVYVAPLDNFQARREGPLVYNAVECFASLWNDGNRVETKYTKPQDLANAGLLGDAALGKVIRYPSDLQRCLISIRLTQITSYHFSRPPISATFQPRATSTARQNFSHIPEDSIPRMLTNPPRTPNLSLSERLIQRIHRCAFARTRCRLVTKTTEGMSPREPYE